MPLSTGEITINDVAKRSFGGKVQLGRMIEEFATNTTIINVLPVVEATEKDKDVGSFIDGWTLNKHSQLTDLDHGPKPTKHDSYGRFDVMSYRDAAIRVRKKHSDYGGAEMNAILTQETTLKLRDIALDNEHDIFYGDPRNDEREMLGLYPRFTLLTDGKGRILSGSHKGELNPYRTLSAGGTSSGSLSSIWLVVPSSTDGACIITPKGSYSAGFQYEKGQYEGGDDGEGGYIRTRTDLFSVQNGLSIRNRNGVIRIANVDYSSGTGIEGISKALYQAVYAIPQFMRRGVRIFCSDEGIPLLWEYFNSKKYASSAEGALPEKLGEDFSIPGLGVFSGTVHITMGEDTVA